MLIAITWYNSLFQLINTIYRDSQAANQHHYVSFTQGTK